MRQQSYPRINVLVLALYLELLTSLLAVCCFAYMVAAGSLPLGGRPLL